MPQYNWTPWMQEAILLANEALPDDIPVGAMILHHTPQFAKPVVIGKGWNTREKCSSPSGHAEIMAMEQASKALGTWRLSDCTLIVTLEPCPMCAAMALQSRIQRIVYGAASPLEGALGSAINLFEVYGYVPEVVAGLCEPAIQANLQDFFTDRRR